MSLLVYTTNCFNLGVTILLDSTIVFFIGAGGGVFFDDDELVANT